MERQVREMNIVCALIIVVLLIVIICQYVMNKAMGIYIKKTDRHPTDEELGACIKEAIQKIMA